MNPRAALYKVIELSRAIADRLVKLQGSLADNTIVISIRESSTNAYESETAQWLARESTSFGLSSRRRIFEDAQRFPPSAFLKPVLERLLVILSAPLSLPLTLVLGGLVKVTSPGPVFYSQIRVGKNGRPFRMWKFRTMCVDADEILRLHLLGNPSASAEWTEAHKLGDDPRVTRVGRVLRRSSLDELPQIWNVLAGTMSLIGPRPITTAEIARYGDRFTSYASVLPGMTGLWQVSGRSNTSYEQRVDLDHRYVTSWSLASDLIILLRTVRCVLKRDGAC